MFQGSGEMGFGNMIPDDLQDAGLLMFNKFNINMTHKL